MNLNNFKQTTPGLYAGSSFSLNGNALGIPGLPSTTPQIQFPTSSTSNTKHQLQATNYDIRENITVRPSRITNHFDLDQCFVFTLLNRENDRGYLNSQVLRRMAGLKPEAGRLNPNRYTKERTTTLTLPMLNYFLHLSAIEAAKEGKQMTIEDVYATIAPMGICITQESVRKMSKKQPDVRTILISGRADMHNIWGYELPPGTNLYFIIKPHKLEQPVYNYGLSSREGTSRTIRYHMETDKDENERVLVDTPWNGNKQVEINKDKFYHFKVEPFFTTDGKHPSLYHTCSFKDDNVLDVEGGFWYIGIIFEETKLEYKYLSMPKDNCVNMACMKRNPSLMAMLTKPINSQG